MVAPVKLVAVGKRPGCPSVKISSGLELLSDLDAGVAELKAVQNP